MPFQGAEALAFVTTTLAIGGGLWAVIGVIAAIILDREE